MSMPEQRDGNTEREKVRVVRYVDTSRNPRFLGIPREDQVEESGSSEGLLGGRNVAEVIAKDTQQLQDAGVTWEQGVMTLKRIAVGLSFLDEKKSKESLPGFPGIKVQFSGARFQFSRLVTTDQLQGDRALIDTLGHESREAEIEYEIGNGKIQKLTVNPQTLYLAEAHHLLEKGNRYEMTGVQLAHLTHIFDERSYEPVQQWVDSQKGSEGAVMGHDEGIVYSDGTEAELNVVRGGVLWLFPPLPNQRFCRVSIEPDENNRMKKFSVERLANNKERGDQDVVSIAYVNGKPKSITVYPKSFEREVKSDGDLSRLGLDQYLRIGNELLKRSHHQKGGLLKGLENAVHALQDAEISSVRNLLRGDTK